METIKCAFDSIAAFRKVKPSAINARAAANERSYHHSSQWFGPFGSDYNAANKGLDYWPEGRKDVQSLADELADQVPPPVSVMRRIVRSDQGDSVEMQDIYCGRIDTAWRVAKRRRQANTSREIWLGYYFSANMNTSGNVMYWRGAAVSAATDLLTKAGYNVGILAYGGARHVDAQARRSVEVEVTIKTPTEPLNPDAVACAIANPAFLRIAAFDLYWSFEWEARDNLGHAYEPEVRENVLTGTDSIYDRASALVWLRKIIARVDNA